MCFVLATNPAQKKSSKVEHGFKVTSDGRLIIRDEEDAGDKGKRLVAWLACISALSMLRHEITFYVTILLFAQIMER